MKYLVGIWFACLYAISVNSQVSQYSTKEFLLYFDQIAAATEEHKELWDRDLYGPLLLVDPTTREAFANMPDKEGALILKDGIYIGTLPREVPVSNTDINWNGLNWAMLELPLPKSGYNRVDLMAHELFHVAQPSLGFVLGKDDNNHLDQKDGRIYLRLEIAALLSALNSNRLTSAEEHIRNALIFRKYRHMIHRGSQVSENKLELLEGLANYTGQVMSGRDKLEWREYLVQRLKQFEDNPTFVRSFAYETVPVYGFFLQQKDYFWNKKVDNVTDLTDFFSEAFGMDSRILLQSYVKQVAEEYNGRKIVDEETKRATVNNELLDNYRNLFFEQPHLEIRIENMEMSFDPKNLIPLDEDEGVVYPTIKISDNWGILTVESGGALLRNDWRWVIVSEPLEITKDKVIGDGWIIELNEGYFIEETSNGVYLLSKKH